MFWILRRTGAVNFFNSINNNHSSNNKISDKNNSRPPRKAYGRLSVDADDANLYRKNLAYHTPANMDDDADDGDDGKSNGDLGHGTYKLQSVANDTLKSNFSNNNHHVHHHQRHKPTTGNGKTHESDSTLTEFGNSNNNNNNIDDRDLNLETGETTVEHHKRVISDMQDDQCHHHHGSCHNSCLHNNTLTTSSSCREFRENMLRNGNIDDKTITRLQAMALQDEDEFDESLTCNVCDRTFHCHRQLASHQQKKRHFGCSGCDSLFSSLMLLEHHKEEFEHWSDEEIDDRRMYCCKRNRRMDDDDFYDTDTATSDAESEDLERLL